MDKTVDIVIKEADKCFNSTERVNSVTTWKELAMYLLNNQDTFFDSFGDIQASLTSAGNSRMDYLYTSNPLYAVRDLSSAFLVTVTNPSNLWSKFIYKKDKFNDLESTSKYLEVQNRRIFDALSESNFYAEISKFWNSLIVFGNAAMLTEEEYDDEGQFTGTKHTTLHLGTIAWKEDAKGSIDTVYRKLAFTAAQMEQLWPNSLPSRVKDLLTAGDSSAKSEILHAIYRRRKYKEGDSKVLPKDRKYASVYIDRTSGEILEENGYSEFPVQVARWDLTPNEVYGRGAGHYALPDVKLLNKMVERGAESLAFKIRPAFIGSQSAILGDKPLSLKPGHLSVVRDIRGIQQLVDQADIPVLDNEINRLMASIERAFFLDKLMLPDRTKIGEMSAFEVSQRLEQMQRILGATMNRVNSEFLQPLVVRVFKILLRNGAIDPLPPEIAAEGLDVSVTFQNQLARSQQVQEAIGIQQYIQSLAMLAQFDPTVFDTVDLDETSKVLARAYGVPPATRKPEAEVAQIRQQRAEAQQQAMQVEMMNKQADTQSKMKGVNNVEQL